MKALDHGRLFDYLDIGEIIILRIGKMIEDYRGLAVFVTVADTGSLSAAGRRLKLSTSVVSHHLSRLEDKLGVTLFFRSTRSMSLTAEGQAALEPARRMMAAGNEALDAINIGQDTSAGTLRVAMPAWGEQSRFRQALWQFAKQYPLVDIALHSSDVPVNLIHEGFDLAIRLGTLADSALKNRRLGDFRLALVASPDYLAVRGPVTSIEELAACDFVGISIVPNGMTLQNGTEAIAFEPQQYRLEVDTVSSAKSAVLAGLGVRQLPMSEVEDEVAQGRLAYVLQGWSIPIMGIYAVWPDSGPQKALTRRLLDFFLEQGVSDAPIR